MNSRLSTTWVPLASLASRANARREAVVRFRQEFGFVADRHLTQPCAARRGNLDGFTCVHRFTPAGRRNGGSTCCAARVASLGKPLSIQALRHVGDVELAAAFGQRVT